MLIVCSVLMTFGAVSVWVCIPEVQELRHVDKGHRIPSKTLEDLGRRNDGKKGN